MLKKNILLRNRDDIQKKYITKKSYTDRLSDS